jgi:hypothetical protein
MHKIPLVLLVASTLDLSASAVRSVPSSHQQALSTFTVGYDAAEAERHKEVAKERAEDYFQFEYPLGSNAVRVTAVKFTVEETKWVEGWPGRYRTCGKAHVEFFDSATRTFGRVSRGLQIVTEEKSDGVIKVQHLDLR